MPIGSVLDSQRALSEGVYEHGVRQILVSPYLGASTSFLLPLTDTSFSSLVMTLIPVSMQNSVDHSSSDADSPAGSPNRKPKASSSKLSSRQPQDSSSKHEAVKAPSEVSSATPQANPTRHESFWFHDGSVILHVESKLFRVHQTILANYSEVFAGLFEVPQPNDESMLEGCHIVELHDSEKDFEDLLHAVYNPSYVHSVARP